jgi:hypothetical protein
MAKNMTKMKNPRSDGVKGKEKEKKKPIDLLID